MVERVVTGGQTGVDRAALDVALRLGVPCGGWCPRGRLAEDGPIAARYPLTETESPLYEVRTRWNARDSDGTLILAYGELKGGTAWTLACARLEHRPVHIEDLAAEPSLSRVQGWLAAHHIRTLNIAGPRESTCPGVYELAAEFLAGLLSA